MRRIIFNQSFNNLLNILIYAINVYYIRDISDWVIIFTTFGISLDLFYKARNSEQSKQNEYRNGQVVKVHDFDWRS